VVLKRDILLCGKEFVSLLRYVKSGELNVLFYEQKAGNYRSSLC
jgi:hypothetical protein